jgi:hypothetical protein
MKKRLSKEARDNRAIQLSHTHPAYYLARGDSAAEAARKATAAQAEAEAAAEAQSSEKPRHPDGSEEQQGKHQPSR